jgi:hypothetical protein
MSPEKQEAASDSLPYVQCAFFCENILIERDGIFSAIRIVDRLMISAPPPGPPQSPANAQLAVALNFLLGLRSGPARGQRNINIVVQFPNGELLPFGGNSVVFHGDETGLLTQVPVHLPIRGEGL